MTAPQPDAGWPVEVTACAGWDSLPEATRTIAETVAAAVMWMLSGRRFGLYPTTVRPVRRGQPGLAEARRWELYLSPHLPGWTSFCGCPGVGPDFGCTCASTARVALPGPVHQVLSVRVDGKLVDPAAYRVDDRRWLVRADGGVWPARQDLAVPEDSPGAFTVTYLRGLPVPAAGRWAAGQYACELGKSLVGDKTCRLPRRVASIVRQGVTTDFVDPSKLAAAGLTGLPDVDGWLVAVNPGGLPRDSSVWSPDLPQAPRRTS